MSAIPYNNVDPITNLAELSLIGNPEDLRRIVDANNWWPNRRLSTFLHEVAHYWTYASTVGHASSTMHTRAMAQLGRMWSDYNNGAKRDFQTDQRSAMMSARQSWVLNLLLRPLSEGIALFSEFDTDSFGPVSTYSLPYTLAFKYFAPPVQKYDLEVYLPDLAGGVNRDHVQSQWNTMQTRRALRAARTSRETIDRKANLLAQPLSSAYGGHLLGYLTVKAMWLRMANRINRLFLEPDLFLCYIRSYFFDDPGLIGVVCTPSEEWLPSCLDYFQARMAELEQVTSDDVAQFESSMRRVSSAPLLDSQWRQSVHADPHWTTLGKAILDRIADHRGEQPPDTMSELEAMAPLITNARRYLYLGGLDVDVTCHEQSVLMTLAGADLFRWQHDAEPTTWRGPGRIEMLVDPSPSSGDLGQRIAVLDATGSGLPYLATVLDAHSDRARATSSPMMTAQVRRAVAARWNTMLYGPEGLAERYKWIEPDIEEAMTVNVDLLYSGWFIPDITDDEQQRVIDMLHRRSADFDNGVMEHIGGPEELRGFALAGIATSNGIELREMIAIARLRGIDIKLLMDCYEPVEEGILPRVFAHGGGLRHYP